MQLTPFRKRHVRSLLTLSKDDTLTLIFSVNEFVFKCSNIHKISATSLTLIPPGKFLLKF